MKKLIIMSLATLIASLSFAQKPDANLVKKVEGMSYYYPQSHFLTSDNDAEGYIRRVSKYSKEAMTKTLEFMEGDYRQAKEILDLKNSIVRKKKGEKADKELAKYFKDADAAKKIFATAEGIVRRYNFIKGVVEKSIESYPIRRMPQGELNYYSSSSSNGFAGWRREIKLEYDKKSGKRTLVFNNMNMHTPVKADEPQPITEIEVDESLFENVRQMIEEGKLYEIAEEYYADVFITDGTNWSLYIRFDDRKTISSGGYMSWPEQSDVINKIDNYLVQEFNKRTGKDFSRSE